MATTKLRKIFVSHGGDRNVDAFADAARAVCRLYEEAIQPSALMAQDWCVSLGVHPSEGSPEVHVRVHNDIGAAEVVSVQVPEGVADLAPAVVALLALDVVHMAMTQLGRLRGWAQPPLDAARRHALDSGLIYRAATRWKASPSRRHRARAVWQIGRHGHCQIWIEVEIRTGGMLIQVSPELLIERAGHAQLETRLLKWWSADVVHLGSANPRCPDESITLALTPQALPVHSPFRDPLPALPLDQPRPATVLDPTQLVEIGARITRDNDELPAAYRSRLLALFAAIKGSEWISWWSAAGRDILIISWSFDALRPGFMMTTKRDFGSVVALRENELYVAVWRQCVSAQQSVDPALLAIQDVAAVLNAVRRRVKLPPHPPLPPVQVGRR